MNAERKLDTVAHFHQVLRQMEPEFATRILREQDEIAQKRVNLSGRRRRSRRKKVT